MMVASHHNDLEAARGCGLNTAFIERPLEFGSQQANDVSPVAENDIHATSIIDLNDQLLKLQNS